MAWENVPFARSNYHRTAAGGVDIPLLNRFFEADPTSRASDTALIARPGTTVYRAVGGDPMRALFTQEGLFGSDLFWVNGQQLSRWDGSSAQAISGTVLNDNPVPITYQSGPGYERVWLADGSQLYYYEGEQKARNNLVADGNPSNGDQVRLDEVYYEFVTTGLDTGSPDGSSGTPWKVLIGVTAEGSLANLANAVDATGTPGSDYSTALTQHNTIQVRRVAETFVTFEAKAAGSAGNSFESTETSAVLSFSSGATLTGGGAHVLVPVPVPEGAETPELPRTVTTLAGYVIISVQGSDRIYFIRPGEFWVEIFASAEAEPDEVLSVKAVGDLLAVEGRSTLEWWSPTGDDSLPFAPIQGRTQAYGLTPYTDIVVDDELVYTDNKGRVRVGSGTRISTHAVEEAIRLSTAT